MGRGHSGRGLKKGVRNSHPPSENYKKDAPPRSRNDIKTKRVFQKGAPMSNRKDGKAESQKQAQKKILVVNTDIFLHDPTVLTNLGDNDIVIPFTVFSRLDEFKNDRDELGDNSRKVSAYVRKICNGRDPKGNVKVKLESGGMLSIDNESDIRLLGPIKDHKDEPDNRTLAVALKWQRDNKDTPVIIITNDINLMNKATAYGISAEEYRNDKVKIYEGFQEMRGNENLFNSIKRTNRVVRPADSDIMPNEFVIITNDKGEKIETICKEGALVRLPIPTTDTQRMFGIKAKNPEQRFALELLFNPKIELVTMFGKAGTGKTLLALYAAFEQLKEKIYSRISVARPIEPMGKDIGFLPGGIDEKMNPWMQPIFDNLEFLFSTRIRPNIEEEISKDAREEKIRQQQRSERKKQKDNNSSKASKVRFPSSKNTDGDKQRVPWQDYIDKGLLYVEPLTYLRGRTLPKQIMIIDEVQNLSSGMIKSILTRAGEGTKVILTGDIGQIDSSYLNKFNNGLSVAVHFFKESHRAGHIALRDSVRSPLAEEAANLL